MSNNKINKEEIIKKILKKIESSEFKNNVFLDKDPCTRINSNILESKESDLFKGFVLEYFKGEVPNFTSLSWSFDFFRFIDQELDSIEIVFFHLSALHFREPSDTLLALSVGFKLNENIYFASNSKSYTENFELNTIRTDFSNFENKINNIKSFVKKYKTSEPEKINNIHVVTLNSQGQYSLQRFEVSKIGKSILENYNDDFKDIDKIIKKALRKKNKGIILLHGIKGAGKSNYIRHLIRSVDKRFIYIPSHLSRNITETNFITFLIHNCQNSVLIMEDVEDLLMSRDAKSYNSGVIADLLNMSDGLMSDSLQIQFICTFNTDMKNIDEALLRPGRLIAEYFFDALTKERAASVYKRLGKEIGKHTILSEIYNDHDAPPRSKKVEEKKIGFSFSK